MDISTIVLIATVLLMVLWFLAIVKMGHNSDFEMRRPLMCDMAQKKYPNKPLLEAIDALYVETLRKIKSAQLYDQDTLDIEDDLEALLHERNRLISEQVTAEHETEIKKREYPLHRFTESQINNNKPFKKLEVKL